ncbi:class I SAM-dependent methyltransferase [Rhizobium hidalgonense]|uniref:class I SAM-dependent methyltransferase n=1 Tax=Rhizobium hidalgonense TaxID=1538159 RepID=UPI000FEC303E|nr:class I SAM-dependent methyltransferase [Rhizobium hidalgonense]RWX14567.1 class I SAM-dependent methyltransferase [Rhizobium hidalgonense]
MWVPSRLRHKRHAPVDLGAVSAVPFDKVREKAEGIEGMLSGFSMQVMDSVLTFQRAVGSEGGIFEFGVYKGRSAAVLSAHAQPTEKFLIVDVERYITDETLSGLFSSPEFHLGSSENFAKDYDGYARLKRSVRFMHVDSSHSYRTTLNELKLADALLSAEGVLCLDDFSNLHYSQILPALYKYLYRSWTDLRVFLVTDAKCYICRRKHFDRYGSFVLNSLLDEMGRRGNRHVTLARTDVDREYRAFYLREKTDPDEDDLYGRSIYGHFYEKP